MITITSPGGHAEANGVRWSATAASGGWSASAQSGRQSASASTQKWYAEAECYVNIGGVPYGGNYAVIPSEEPQVLDTRGKTLAGNVTIGAIPSNYGLITYDGISITVS